MKKFITVVLLMALTGQMLIAQRHFLHLGEKLEVLDVVSLPKQICLDDKAETSDHPWIMLFRNYFRPGSYQAYQRFFLAEDWPGITKEEYNQWQLRLDNSKIWMDGILHVQDKNGIEYLIFQYSRETREFIYANSAIFKKVNTSWKHTSNANDKGILGLKKTGLVNVEFLNALPRDAYTVNLDNLAQNNLRSAIEKFDRNILFAKIEEVMRTKNISEMDLVYSKTLFLQKAEFEMAYYLSETYKIDPYDLMTQFNQAFGFTLFKFAHASETK